MKRKTVGILTGGGDCPGLNAVIRAAVKTASSLDLDVIGVRDGFTGLLDPPRMEQLQPADVRGLLPRGGTILGTSNRANPFSFTEKPGAPGVNRSDEVLRNARAANLDALIVIGGDGTLSIALELSALGLRVIGVPKTIDNDLKATDLTFGFDTAVATATDALDRLHTTAESHHRIMVVEVMGRTAGWIAITAGIAGGADAILIPEIPFRVQAVVEKIERRASRGSSFSIVVVAEGAMPAGGSATYHDVAAKRLGGVAASLAQDLEAQTGKETRTTVLGHVQRGGSPSAFDRVLASRFGVAAANAAWRLLDGGAVEPRMIALRGTEIDDVSLGEAVSERKLVPVDGELVATARALGVSFGDR